MTRRWGVVFAPQSGAGLAWQGKWKMFAPEKAGGDSIHLLSVPRNPRGVGRRTLIIPALSVFGQ